MEQENKPSAEKPKQEATVLILSEEDKKRLAKYQNKLLPFLIGLPSVLIIVFIWLTTNQINEFNDKINNKKSAEIIGTVIPSGTDEAFKNNVEYIKWLSIIHMEEVSINKRYEQAGFLLMSRVLVKYLGFLTGMILAIVGSAFIIGKLSEGTTTMGGNFSKDLSFNVASSSPGILFGFFGTALMITCLSINTEIGVQDQPLYLHPNNIQLIDSKPAVVPKQVNKINPDLLDSMDKANMK